VKHTLLCWSICAALASPAEAGVTGWRHDGTMRFPEARPPATWSRDTHVRWSAPLPAWGNATPVRLGTQVCVTIEPATLACFDADTGRPTWSATNHVEDTATGAARDALVKQRAQAVTDREALTEVQRSYSQLQRDARRGDTEATAKLGPLAQRMGALKTSVAAARHLLLPADTDIIGYATPTPVTDGRLIWVLTGQGVLSAFDTSGKRQWSRWLGPPVEPMRGYQNGHSSSPWLLDGTLIVPYGALRGLDPVTGATRWEVGRWDHYGTPAYGTVDGVGIVFTPGGEAVRARDGRVLNDKLGALYYLGPTVHDGVLYQVGNTGNTERGDKTVIARALRLRLTGDQLAADELWRVDLQANDRFYNAPLVHGEVLYTVSAALELFALSTRTGEVLSRRSLRALAPLGEAYPAPAIVGGQLHLTTFTGDTVVLSLADPRQPAPIGVQHLEELRATPLYAGDRIYVRGATRLWCLDE
jgi:outer membrane protein assembly factor BamB